MNPLHMNSNKFHNITVNTKEVLTQEKTNYNSERIHTSAPDSNLAHTDTWTCTNTYRHCVTQKLTNYCYIITKYKMLENYNTPHKTPLPPAEAMQADAVIITDCTSVSWFLLLESWQNMAYHIILCGRKDDTKTCSSGRLSPSFQTCYIQNVFF
jgi:hypothetical protein